MTIEFCYLVFITADYYAINNLTVPVFLLKKKYGLFIFATLLIIAVSSAIRALIAMQMNLHFFQPTSIVGFGSLYFNSVVNITIWVLAVTLGKMILDKMQTQQLVESLDKERKKMNWII